MTRSSACLWLILLACGRRDAPSLETESTGAETSSGWTTGGAEAGSGSGSSTGQDGGEASSSSSTSSSGSGSASGAEAGSGETAGSGTADDGGEPTSSATEGCPPCVPPPTDACVGTGPCGCGPYECPAYGPCSASFQCGEGELCEFAGTDEPVTLCTAACDSVDDCPGAPDGGDVDCLPLSGSEVCVLRCRRESDCPDGAVCQALGEDDVCMWP